MAKQTFTVGQVLTAAQVTALQTNGFNQTVSTKTTSYVLVAADVGTRVYMNAAGATTITVNTGLFAAGDTLWLGNIGAGACVVTAGTATVDKFATASLTLSQYQSAVLYFTSTGVSILYSDAAGASTPLTTKGDLFGFSTVNARVPIGANNTVLTADSAEALGLKWATATATPQNFTQIGSTVTMTGASSFTISGISGMNALLVQFFDVGAATSIQLGVRPNNNTTGSNYQYASLAMQMPTIYAQTQIVAENSNSTSMIQLGQADFGYFSGYIMLQGCNSSGVKVFNSFGGSNQTASRYLYSTGGHFISSAAITSMTILTGGGQNFTGGNYRIFGSA